MSGFWYTVYMILQALALFIWIAGFIIGLGAVVVIDIHGFLGRKSRYWTVATTRTHKITKPLIWVGTILVAVGGIWYYSIVGVTWITIVHAIILGILLLNGAYLSFVVSPYLLKQERSTEGVKILPPSWQRRITLGLLIGDTGWWIAVALFVWLIVAR